jgi:putative hemolysin
MSVGTEILLTFLLILSNGLFSMSELAMVSARKARLQKLAEHGDRSAQAALNMAENPNRMFSTVQIGISLVGVLSGAVGGAALAEHLVPVIARVDFLRPYSQGLSLVIVVLIITYFTLVLGELIPKRLAMGHPEGIARSMARPMRVLSWLARPVVSLLSVSTEFGLRLMGVRPSEAPAVTEEEIRLMLDQGAEIGLIKEAEQDMVESVFRLGDRRVDAIMTPRTEMVWLDLDETQEDLLRKILDTNHTQFPVAQGSLDNILGILTIRDLLAARLNGQEIDLKNLIQPPIFVPGSTPALKVLDEVKKTGLKLALILDEYGGITGMVTQDDILESLVGDISVSGEPEQSGAYQREDGSWLFDGLMRVDELKEILDVEDLPDENRAGYQTLGGLVMSQLGEIPTTGEGFEWKGFRFEVVDMDGRRVDKVLVVPPGKNQ